ncbi:helix-turn-helix domain-containing protein [Neobacillus sedimentimangrovi]|uniref:Helix-turn-helix domain-containing protein n=1 Tax=Neobacillus sedimentimangrovi TaxID=2699460 RepID=A0ABS8QHU2_9BACI|nr:helix-turn-helix transcriptional regulator [Neobacillus sedimentimangrovi]MCD4838184.1 helix-turn-helix domain-containing protein [Neobacillus sedimentimangrovi]
MLLKSRIGELIEAAGYKKKYIANLLGISPTQLSNWISGRSYPPIDKAFKLAEILGCLVDDLYEKIDPLQPKDPISV